MIKDKGNEIVVNYIESEAEDKDEGSYIKVNDNYKDPIVADWLNSD